MSFYFISCNIKWMCHIKVTLSWNLSSYCNSPSNEKKNGKLIMFLSFSSHLFFSIFYLRKYWNHENFRLLIFDGFTHFVMSWVQLHYFYKISVCMWHKFWICTRAKTIRWNCVQFYIQLHLDINWWWLDFPAVQTFQFL